MTTVIRLSSVLVAMLSRTRQHPSAFQRGLACLLAGIVIALGLLAVEPRAHAWLHADTPHGACPSHSASAPESHTDCPVALFAQGVVTPLEGPSLAAVALSVERAVFPAQRELLLSNPPFWHLPGRGPPQG